MFSTVAASFLGFFFTINLETFGLVTLFNDVGSDKNALQALKASDWQLEAAFDMFYSQPQPRSNGDMRRLEELYNRYKGERPSFSLVD